MLHLSLQGIGILSHSLVVNAESQTSSHFLTLLRDAVRLSERTDLENVRIVPTFSQSRVGEDEANWRVSWVETQQSFLIFHNQVVSRYVVASYSLLLIAVLDALGLGVDGEITLMGLVDRDAAEILHIFRVVHILIFVQLCPVFLFEYFSIASQHRIAVFIILAILGNLVDKEKGEALDATMEERTLFAEVRLDGFPYLDASLVVGSYVADYFLQHQTFAVAELYLAASRLTGIHHDVGNHEPLVLQHVSRGTIEVIAFSQLLVDSLDGSRSALLFYLQPYLWGLVFREQQLCKIDIAVGTFQVLQFKAYYLYLLHQFVVVGIKCIEYIHRIVVFLVGSGVIQSEERIEGFECCLCSGTSHLLRFIQNDDRVVGCKNGDRLSGTELIAF